MDWAPLQSKGVNGGTYTFVDPETEVGEWLYRIVDVDRSGKSTVLCQAMIDVQSQGEKSFNTVAVGALAALFAGLAFAATQMDPLTR